MNFFWKGRRELECPEANGPPHLAAQKLSREIELARVRIRLYLDNTAAHQLLLIGSIYNLLEARHDQEFLRLANKHGHNVAQTNVKYQKELVVLNKATLQDLCGFLEYLKGAFTLWKVRRVIAKKKEKLQDGRKSGQDTRDSRQDGAKLGQDFSVSGPAGPNSAKNGPNSGSAFAPADLDSAPDFIVDPISFEIFHEPVITPSGITYEKSVLYAYLKDHRFKDPITKEVLTMDKLVPNLAVKEAATAFLAQNGI